jgi:hypothetical protein
MVLSAADVLIVFIVVVVEIDVYARIDVDVISGFDWLLFIYLFLLI